MKSRIKAIRKYYKLTQTEFAEKLGLKQSTISYYEKGINIPTSSILKSISNTFNIDYDWLCTGEGEMLINEDILSPLTNYLNENDIALIRYYISLPEETRNNISTHILSIAKNLKENP